MQTMEKRVKKHGNWASFLLVPVAFSIMLATIFYLTLAPVVLPFIDVFKLFIGNSKANDLPVPSMFTAIAESLEKTEDDIPLSGFIFPEKGAHYGEIEIEGTSIKADLYWDDSPKELNAGVGTYSGGWLPGFERTIMLAGHTMTFFNGLGDAEIGNKINIETYYGTYVYEITDAVVKDHQDTSAYDFSREDENIVLYTCYPFNSVGLTPTRYFVYAKYVSGPKIVDDK